MGGHCERRGWIRIRAKRRRCYEGDLSELLHLFFFEIWFVEDDNYGFYGKIESTYLSIFQIVPDGAAELSGLEVGKKIIGVNDQNAETLRPSAIVELIRGSKESVRLWVRGNA